MLTRCRGLTAIPCTLMRGGTSRGAFFNAADIPDDPSLRDRLLLKAMGSPHPLQIDGIGGGQTLTSKVAIVGPPSRPGTDVDYLFAQVSVTDEIVDTRASCGNLLAAVGPFAIEAGLFEPTGSAAAVRVHNRNTGVICEARFNTPGGMVDYGCSDGIDGAPGGGAHIRLTFLDAQGAITGALLPTGAAAEIIDGVPVTMIDYSIPVMILDARDFGLGGQEPPEAISRDAALLARIERLRLQAGLLMGLGDVGRRVSPKVALLSPPAHGGTLTSRYLTPWACHTAHAVTGAMALAVACTIDGSVAARVIGTALPSNTVVRIEHPAGAIDIRLSTATEHGQANVPNASVVRTARKLFQGDVLIPDDVWPTRRPLPAQLDARDS